VLFIAFVALLHDISSYFIIACHCFNIAIAVNAKSLQPLQIIAAIALPLPCNILSLLDIASNTFSIGTFAFLFVLAFFKRK
jgi:hypothetical protein